MLAAFVLASFARHTYSNNIHYYSVYLLPWQVVSCEASSMKTLSSNILSTSRFLHSRPFVVSSFT